MLLPSGRLIPSPEIQVSTGKDLFLPRGRLGSKLPLAYLTPFFFLISQIGCPRLLSLLSLCLGFLLSDSFDL